MTRLNDEFPQRMHYRGILGRFLHTRAILQNHRGQPRAAKESLEKILDLVGSADVSDPEQSMDTMLFAQTYTRLADVLNQIGETAPAQQAASKARELWKFAPSAILQRPPSRLQDPWGPDSLPEDTRPDTDIPLKPLPVRSGL